MIRRDRTRMELAHLGRIYSQLHSCAGKRCGIFAGCSRWKTAPPVVRATPTRRGITACSDSQLLLSVHPATRNSFEHLSSVS